MNTPQLQSIALGLAAAWLWAGSAAAAPGANLDLARQLNETFVEVARRSARVVVVLEVVQKPPPRREEPEEDGSFESLPPGFWKRFHEEFRRQAPERTRGQGSGVILRKDGYILTNRHVVEDAESILVRLQDGRSFPATLRGADAPSDLAVVKIDADNLPAATLADSSRTQVGEFAIAVGSPFSLDFSVTFGHVSAKERANVIPHYEGVSMDQEFIQTDALINPGNSGGPLFNLEGEVIGINTLIRGLQTGIGFAIPSNLAREISDQLIAEGKFTRPWLGIGISALRDNPDFRAMLGGIEEGVIVSSILPDGPAAKSPLRPTDVITAVDGQPVTTPQQLRTEIRRKKIGQPITLGVHRKGQTLDLQVSPGEWTQPETTVIAGKRPAAPEHAPARLGLTVQSLTRELAAKFGVNALEGVVVTAVEKGSPASRKGLKPGDVITSIDQQPVTTPKEFQQALKQTDPAKGALLNLVTDNVARFEILKP